MEQIGKEPANESAEMEPILEANVELTEPVPCVTSCRWQLVYVGFFGCICIYLTRVNMSMAIICMTYDSIEGNSSDGGNVSEFENVSSFFELSAPFKQDETCPNIIDKETKLEGVFDWDRQLRGYILSSFHWGYLLTQVPGGWLADSFGAKKVIGISTMINAVATLLSPVCARASPWALMAMRIINGLAQGVFFPSIVTLLTSWAPLAEKSTMYAYLGSGTTMGSITSFFLSGIICDELGWPWVFYIYGILSAFGTILWFFLVYDTPGIHPFISEAEKNYLQQQIIGEESEHVSPPWKKIATSIPVLALMAAAFVNGWVFYMALSSFTQYMHDILQFDIKQNGFYNSLPRVCKMAVIVLVGPLADLGIRKFISVTTMRKVMVLIMLVPSVVLLCGAGYLDCHQWQVAVVIICLSEAFSACAAPGMHMNSMDIAPRYAGIVKGIQNTVENVPGLVVPIMVGEVVRNGYQDEWRTVFFIGAGWSLFGALVYTLFGSGEVQPWAKEQKDEGTPGTGIGEKMLNDDESIQQKAEIEI